MKPPLARKPKRRPSVRDTAATPEGCYAKIVDAFLGRPGVSVGAGSKKGFGASALSTGGKIFAMLSSRSRFVVKLPKSRVDALVTSGIGRRFDPGHGRLMKEWLEVASIDEAEWRMLAEEALTFIAAQT